MRTFLTAVFVLFTPFSILGQAIEIESPTLGTPNTEDGFEPDSIFYVADEINFLVMSNGVLKWGIGYSNSVKLHTEVNIDKAFFYKEEDLLVIFFTESDAEGATSRAQQIDLAKKESIWKTEIRGFNLGHPIIRDGFAYVGAIGSIEKFDLTTGKYEFRIDDLYDPQKYSFNSFDTVHFHNEETIFISENYYSGRMDSVIVNEKTKKYRVSK